MGVPIPKTNRQFDAGEERRSPFRFSRIIDMLVSPSKSIEQEDLRLKAKLVAGTSAFLVVLLVIGGVTMAVRRGGFPASHAVSILVLSAAYVLCRTRFLVVGSFLSVVGLSIPSFVLAFVRYGLDQEGTRIALMWLSIPVVFASLVLTMRYAIIVSCLLTISVLLFPLMMGGPNSIDTFPTFGLLLALFAFTILIAYVLRRGNLILMEQIRERRRAEDALKTINEQLETRVAERTRQLSKTNQTLQVLISSSPAAVIMLDQNGRIVLWNPAAEEIFGWKEQDILGQENPVLPLGQDVRSDRPFGVVAQSRVHIGLEFHAKTKNGAEVDVSLSTAPLHDSAGAIVGTIGVLLNTTEQRRLEAQFRQVQKMEAIGRLAGGVAHDFNNLLTIINGSSEILLEEVAGDAENREMVEDIYDAGTRATALVKQLLAFSRRQEFSLEMVDVHDVITGITKMLSRLIDPKVELQLELSAIKTVIKADKGQLEQVIMNLVVNANDAIEESGFVRIATRNSGSKLSAPMGRSKEDDADTLEISVVDNGVGMPPKVRDKVFEPFFTTKEIGRGTGLGLATVYGIVSQGGWAIDIDSALGQGTTFLIRVPLAEANMDSEDELVDGGLPGGEESILVVEDVVRVRSLAERILKRLGYRVQTASNGVEALELFRKNYEEIDLVLSDVMMPQMDGPSSVYEMRMIRTDLPVVFMSGRADMAVDFVNALSESIPLLEKPFTTESLAKTVRRVLDMGGIGAAVSFPPPKL